MLAERLDELRQEQRELAEEQEQRAREFARVHEAHQHAMYGLALRAAGIAGRIEELAALEELEEE